MSYIRGKCYLFYHVGYLKVTNSCCPAWCFRCFSSSLMTWCLYFFSYFCGCCCCRPSLLFVDQVFVIVVVQILRFLPVDWLTYGLIKNYIKVSSELLRVSRWSSHLIHLKEASCRAAGSGKVERFIHGKQPDCVSCLREEMHNHYIYFPLDLTTNLTSLTNLLTVRRSHFPKRACNVK